MSSSHAFSSVKLSESERLHRVAEILCNAIVRSTIEAGIERPSLETVPDSPAVAEFKLRGRECEDEQRVVRYLTLVGEASPGGIRGALGFSRSKTSRVLQRLSLAGRVVGTGQTRQALYQLSLREPAASKIGLN